MSRASLSNPQLTMSNLLKHAIQYRNEKKLDSTDLGEVLQVMVLDDWDPSHHLIRSGVPTEFYEIFNARCQNSRFSDTPEWIKPRERKKRRQNTTKVQTTF